MTYSRDELISICERAFVKQEHWADRDSFAAQCQIGKAFVLLKAGCEFKVLTEENQTGNHKLITDDKTVWIKIMAVGFAAFELGDLETETFYLPTEARLEEVDGKDWY